MMKIRSKLFENIKISQMVSTVILVTTVFSILTFGLIYYMYYEADVKNSTALTSTFEAMGGLFGGFTTLAAAFIASQLFNDWKESQTGTNRSELAKNIHISLIELKSLCDYNFGVLKSDIILDQAANIPEISEDFKENRTLRKNLYESEKLIFKKEYSGLLNKLIINLRTYESIFQVNLLPEDENFNFNSYSYHIAALYTYLQTNNNYKELNLLKDTTEKLKLRMETTYIGNIFKETKKFINLTN